MFVLKYFLEKKKLPAKNVLWRSFEKQFKNKPQKVWWEAKFRRISVPSRILLQPGRKDQEINSAEGIPSFCFSFSDASATKQILFHGFFFAPGISERYLMLM